MPCAPRRKRLERACLTLERPTQSQHAPMCVLWGLEVTSSEGWATRACVLSQDVDDWAA